LRTAALLAKIVDRAQAEDLLHRRPRNATKTVTVAEGIARGFREFGRRVRGVRTWVPPARWFAALALVVALVSLISGGRASGDPIDDQRSQAKALQDQIDANGVQIDALSEQYNGAQYRLEQAQAAIVDAHQKLDATQTEVARLKGSVNERAAALYRSVGQGGPIDLDVSTPARMITSSKYSSLAAKHDTQLLDQLRRAENALRDWQTKAEQARAQAEHDQNQIQQAETDVKAANSHQEQLLSQVNGQIAQLVAEERARNEAAALAAAQARFAATSPAGNAPVSGAAGAAITYAEGQLGKPYCYGGAGPSCFDCSGLTMQAWGAAGVVMPHYSGAQYSMFPHVPLNAMQPGDLVFWGPGGSQHVGLYIGGGQMIAAPHTGDVVKIQAVYGSPVGAVRPG
jgi:peptidoglycan DL-endopeptidase CwlO